MAQLKRVGGFYLLSLLAFACTQRPTSVVETNPALSASGGAASGSSSGCTTNTSTIALTSVGVRSSMPNQNLSARALSRNGSQSVFFVYDQAPCSQGQSGTAAISSITIGESAQMACALVVSPGFTNTFQCTTAPFSNYSGLRSEMHRMTITYVDGTSTVLLNAFEIMNFTGPEVEQYASYCSASRHCGVSSIDNPVNYPDSNPRVWNNFVLKIAKSLRMI